ncbi:hypothetical protein TCAL_00775 [Tigriopus californicus]|uniref:BTB domain-containing protein n=1 Tax=Tigriopus californicus TaxID=6832 RepID=A0A553PAB2_TIGCA|nr:protein roadkill-like [Tigriopus californicus]TRY74609.1 hypothetical protein TCAL_00775 [Tigriopus californicus]|eukprot:TCALIF_00775-PA protein Name:"Similar to spop-b Speckle-type POZ protein B (Xenopus laevis)" AED:0.15 eAED:0.16 QI:0/-1/0/1/-1/1/1/0/370
MEENIWSSHLKTRIATASHTFIINDFLSKLEKSQPKKVVTYSSVPFTTWDPSSEDADLEFRIAVRVRSETPSEPVDEKSADVSVILSYCPENFRIPAKPDANYLRPNIREPAVALIPVTCKFWILGENFKPIGECEHLEGYYRNRGYPIDCILPLDLSSPKTGLLRTDNSLAIRCLVELDCGDVVVAGTALPLDFDQPRNQRLSPYVFPDMNLVCAEQLYFPCHKHMLAASSDVFMAMFSNESHQEVKCNEVHVEDVDPIAVEKLIEFVYNNEIEDFDGCAHELIYAADKYNMANLKTYAINNAVKTLSIENVCDFITLGELVQSEFLMKTALEFAFDHAEEVIKSDRLKNLSQNSLKQLFEAAIKFRKL